MCTGFACMSIYASRDETNKRTVLTRCSILAARPECVLRSYLVRFRSSPLVSPIPFGFPCEPVANNMLTSRDARVIGDRLLQIVIGQEHYSWIMATPQAYKYSVSVLVRRSQNTQGKGCRIVSLRRLHADRFWSWIFCPFGRFASRSWFSCRIRELCQTLIFIRNGSLLILRSDYLKWIK
jgi:hypothetical protein